MNIDDLRANERRTGCMRMQNVLMVAERRRNLFSIVTINDKEFSFHAKERYCEVCDKNGHLILGVGLLK